MRVLRTGGNFCGIVYCSEHAEIFAQLIAALACCTILIYCTNAWLFICGEKCNF
jgi:hypothetical protein